jgi:subtilisin family serine protease
LNSERYSIHAESLWPLTNSTPDVVVAVLDTGLPGPIFALKGWNITLLRHHEPGSDFISDASISMYSDGRDGFAYDPGDAGPDCPEANWQGLRVASVLAEDHQSPLRGVAQNCTLLPVRVLGMCRSSYASNMAGKIVWAGGGAINGLPPNTHRAHVISMSFTGGGGAPITCSQQ